MSAVIVIGLQWGDEGKGKIVDVLVEHAHAVVRFQGGNNAGHTVVHGDKEYRLSLLPSGVLCEGKLCVIAGGVVIDPWALISEIERCRSAGLSISANTLGIADNASLILPWHREIDAAEESSAGSDAIGTTGRGIGPAYEDRCGRRAVRVCDLRDGQRLRAALEKCAKRHNALRRYHGMEDVDVEATAQALLEIAPQILTYAVRVPQFLHALSASRRRILFEGAQGAMLDVDHGSYPFVTSSNTVAAQACVSCGFPADAIGCVLGVAKAYTTRVGNGPMPSEITGASADIIGERGAEFGTVTARKRRIGWFDAVQVRSVVRFNGVHHIALTKLDVLDGMDEVKICVGYRLGNTTIDYLPTNADEMERVQPIWETMPGWAKDSSISANSSSELSPHALAFIARIEALVGAPVTMVSCSPDRDDTFIETNPFGGSVLAQHAND